MNKIVVLYSELADYSIACFKHLSTQAEVLLVHWPVNPEAPFKFDLTFCTTISRDEISELGLIQKVEAFKPDLILCSGWMDKWYMHVCRIQRKNCITVLSMDNHWTGTLKQQIARLVSPVTIKRAFSHAFVPGEIQKKYALKLGFNSNRIQTGFYSADVDRFKAYDDQVKEHRTSDPKRFLYLGRYVKHKGIYDLWNAFASVRLKHPDWELWCVGTGDEFENRVEGEGIRHFGFVQPSELLPILSDSSVYILPSHFEPWGVSVHEMAVVGYPMILSDQIGSREAYLVDGSNGFVFESGNSNQLADAMCKLAEKTEVERLKMGEQSRDLGLKMNPSIWSTRLLSFFNAS